MAKPMRRTGMHRCSASSTSGTDTTVDKTPHIAGMVDEGRHVLSRPTRYLESDQPIRLDGIEFGKDTRDLVVMGLEQV